jgi:hypothetical protein
MLNSLKIKVPFFPPVEEEQARTIASRNIYRRAMRSKAEAVFTLAELSTTQKALNEKRNRTPRGNWRDDWSTLLVRPEVIVIINIIKARHLQNTGLELSNAEAIAALITAGLPALLRNDAFATASR